MSVLCEEAKSIDVVGLSSHSPPISLVRYTMIDMYLSLSAFSGEVVPLRVMDVMYVIPCCRGLSANSRRIVPHVNK